MKGEYFMKRKKLMAVMLRSAMMLSGMGVIAQADETQDKEPVTLTMVLLTDGDRLCSLTAEVDARVSEICANALNTTVNIERVSLWDYATTMNLKLFIWRTLRPLPGMDELQYLCIQRIFPGSGTL